MNRRDFLCGLFRRDKVGRCRLPATGNADAGIGADTPIRESSQDLLRRSDFAARIATVLSATSLDEGRIFAIRGGWGFGKSSLKHLVIEKLKARDNKVPHLDFNPWQWGDGDAIARALFSEIANSLGTVHSKAAARRAKKFRIYGAILTESAKPLAKAAGNKQLLTSFLTSGSVVALASVAEFPIPEVKIFAITLAIFSFVILLTGRGIAYLGRDRTSDPLDEIRTSLEAQLRQLPQPLVIFVDDIDRLEPEQIRLLLRHIKANANLPNLIFVLIFQPSIVEAALDPIAGGNGAAFLEKIVQANFDLPAVPISAVHRIFEAQLNELAGRYATEENGFDQKRWHDDLIKRIAPYVRNLRDARRLLSSIAAHLPLHVHDNTFAVNLLDFLVLETMRVFEPRLHHQLFGDRILLLQPDRPGGYGDKTAKMQGVEELLTTVNETRRDIARDILERLFPPLTVGRQPGLFPYWIAQKRVCSEIHFPLYFELQTADGEISERDFVAFLTASSDADRMENVLAGIEARKLLPSLARRLEMSVQQLPVSNAVVLLPAMFRLGEKLRMSNSTGPFDSALHSTSMTVARFLQEISRKTVPHPALPKTLGDLTVTALRESGGLSVGMKLISLIERGAEDENVFDIFPPLYEDDLQAVKAEFLRQVRQLAEKPEQMMSRPDVTELLRCWRDCSGSTDEPGHWVKKSTDRGFAALVTAMMSRRTHSSWGGRVTDTYDTFDKESVATFIGIEAAQERLDTIDTGGLPADQIHALNVLREHLARWGVDEFRLEATGKHG